MRKFEMICAVEEYDSADELNEAERALISAATEALQSAYAPYSQFKVGAAVLMANGNIVRGSNQENAAYPSGLCAERVAVFSAGSQFPDDKIRVVAITHSPGPEHPIAPCGACRQVLLEYELKQKENIRILLVHPGGKIYSISSVKDLLPLQFDGWWLRKLAD